MSSSFIDDLIAATKSHGVRCVIIGGDHDYDEADDDLVPATALMDSQVETDDAEAQQLRAQVQQLSSNLQAKEQELIALRQKVSTATVTATATGAAQQVPAGDHGSSDEQSIEILGFEDDKLLRKLQRLGYDTVGKLREAFYAATLANDPVKLKKDWLIEVGMKLAGAGPSSSGTFTAVAGDAVAAGGASDVPAGHNDRPWLERLSLSRDKQRKINELKAALAEKQAEANNYTTKKQEVPESLDEDILGLEDDIALVEAQIVAMRWCMGLDPSKEITLDEALQRANLGPWMENPQPRVSPPA